MSPPIQKRILFIHNDDKAVSQFKSAMEKEDFVVAHAHTAEDGMTLFCENPFPLVVTDHHLSGMTGLEVCRRLQEQDSDPAVIFLTPVDDPGVSVDALKFGVQRCVPLIDNSVFVDVLPTVIIRLMNRREAARHATDMEAKLRRSEARFLQSEVMSHSCHWESDETQTLWVYASANTENILGIPIEDLLGDYERYIQHIHPDDKDRVRQIYADAAKNDGPYEAHYRFCRPDGRIIHLLEYAVPIIGDNGKILFYRGSTQDVTAQDDAEARYRTVVENAVEAIITINSEGVIQSFNRAAQTQFQFSSSEAIGQNVKMLMPDEIAEQHDTYISQYLSTRQAHIIGIGREIEAQRKDGSVFPALLSVSALEIGGSISFTGLIRDISDQKETETMLILAKNEAERANRAKSEFLSSMSHELRTPLNAVLGFAQMLEYNPEETLSPKQQESVDLIKRGGRHLLTLINEVLELAKIEAGRVDLSLENIDVPKVIEECASIAGATAVDRNIELTNLTRDKDLTKVRADNTRLKQILLNLLSNAVKYNKDAGSISIDAINTDDNFVRISISDTGIGLTEREQRKIFEPFERLGKQSEDVEGTGIGLTITRQLINLMNGRMGFVSEIGEGSTFWIELPNANHNTLHDPEQDANPRRRKSDIKVELEGPIADSDTSYNALYVEDNESNIMLMKSIFDSIPNATLHVTGTGRDGVDYAKKNKPDVILMDINLPGMDGIEATRILQRKKETADIPIIAVSASIWRARNGVQEDVDFYQYIEKPFDVIEIRDSIHKALMERFEESKKH